MKTENRIKNGRESHRNCTRITEVAFKQYFSLFYLGTFLLVIFSINQELYVFIVVRESYGKCIMLLVIFFVLTENRTNFCRGKLNLQLSFWLCDSRK